MSTNRKDDHVQLAEELTTEGRAAHPAGGFHDLRFMHHSFNGLARDAVDISTTVTGAHWPVPFYINAMTGGSEKTGQINADLARAAAATGVAMASGSVSAALREPALEPTFRIVRDSAPEAFILANVSPEASVEQARRAVDLLDANALQIHVNPAQELVMPEETATSAPGSTALPRSSPGWTCPWSSRRSASDSAARASRSLWSGG